MLKFEKALLDFRSLDFWRRHRICLAVSGGADSTALFCALTRLAHQEGFADLLMAGHVNHGVRGEESDGDAQFVRELAERQSIHYEECRIKSSVLHRQIAISGSFEGAARDLRYSLLREMAGKFGARYLVTAHTKDDQLETILYRIFRGTGLEGLKAIPQCRPLDEALTILRPMLSLSRQDVIRYLSELGQDYREDSSNAETEFARNKIRHQLIPVLNEIFPTRWEGALERLSANAAEVSDLIRQQIKILEEQAIIFSHPNEVILLRTSLSCDLSDVLLCEFFRSIWREQNWHLNEMGRDQWKRLTEMIRTNAGNRQKERAEFPGGITATVEEDRMILTRLSL